VTAASEGARSAAAAVGSQQAVTATEPLRAATATEPQQAVMVMTATTATAVTAPSTSPVPAPAGNPRTAVVEIPDDDVPPPGWDQWVSLPASAPEASAGALVVRDDGDAALGCPVGGAGASSLLTVNSCIKVRLDFQADKSPVVVKGPFFPRVVNPRYQICGTMCNTRIQSSKARKAIL
jgi:hypothetical protein